MVFPSEIKRSYQRYKLYNRSAHPFKIWLMETGILIARLLVLLVFLAVIALLISNTSFGPLGNLFERDSEQSANLQLLPESSNTQTAAIIAAKAPAPETVEFSAPLTSITDSPIAGAASNSPEILGPGWLLEQAVGDYTIQFASASDLSKLVDFSNQFSSSETVTIYPFQRRNDEIVYGLASGIYTDFASAKLAIDDMPDSLRENQPWIRAIDKVQAEIARFRTQ